ncbi:interleukin-6 receptor subunit beta isoform X1 [Seriola dumerili]|uniref:interleukin-6 receptor subunit beta isoform X1 n=1 Tax=Seriola dumerili TaxID=41447 RepID=UPI000BBF1E97|nr:interleukin-6 receptor subunit beta isoform X1 [Seriola dumerili]
MVSARVLQLLGLACLASAVPTTGGNNNHLVIAPQSPVLEIGTTFTATCMIINTAEITADDLYWDLAKTTIPRDHYTKVNSSALSVTLTVISEQREWLYCLCKKVSANVILNGGRFIHGILLTKGYRPEKPENLTCVALQEKKHISSTVTCHWDAVGRQTLDVPTIYTLYFRVLSSVASYNMTTSGNSAKISMSVFPHFMEVEIWVEAHNKLGTVETEHLKRESGYVVKTNPPGDVEAISEPSFSTSLLINWTRPIGKEYVALTYQIRFCKNASQSWTYVPLGETAKDIQSFRIQYLQPDTMYVTQVRCKNSKEGYGHWSEWSHRAVKRTPEGRPTGKPDLWRVISEEGGIGERRVQFLCKDPVTANGRIIRFDMKIQGQRGKVMNGSLEWERIPVNKSEEDYSSTRTNITFLKEIYLADRKSIIVDVIAVNSVGKSAPASLVVPERALERPPVEGLRVWSDGRQLWLEWTPPNRSTVSEYVVEWITGDQVDWQRENRSTRLTAIKGHLEKFVCYTVSVYPIYNRVAGKAVRVEAFLEQGAPLEGPVLELNGKPGRNHAEVTWTEIPPHSRRGFITNYTIFYSSVTEKHSVLVPGNITSYTLTSLSGNTRYEMCVMASTIAGSATGICHAFTTPKYEDGVIELIVVGVSLGFLFVFVMTMLLCFYKKDVIKRNFWPQIPNPGESTIGNWSPDYPLKAETPKENCLSGISVLDVDVCDAKCVFEEDKTSLPLKKDKYMSEEHSSGIGGSSCMSSPRQSVSDSDEGGDMADTTASTVQYSSVVAFSGYKGQTPSSQPQQGIFSRSESTQPLLDSEENPDMLVQERYPRQSCFTHATGNEDSTNQLEAEQQEMLEPLDFCSLEEDSEQTAPTDEQSADWLPAAPVSSYMPQLGGYRPQ